MEVALIAAVLCLAVSTAFLASSIPFVIMYYLSLFVRMDEKFVKVQKQIDNLDFAVSELLEKVGVKAEE